MSAKEYFDSLISDRDTDFVSQWNILPENSELKEVCSFISGERRYDRYWRVVYMWLPDKTYWLSGVFSVGGDGEGRGFYGSIEQISVADTNTILAFCKLPYNEFVCNGDNDGQSIY